MDTTSPGTAASDAADTSADSAAPAAARKDTVLVIVFWAWAALLLLATLAQLFGWDGVLDVLDVKRWFAR